MAIAGTSEIMTRRMALAMEESTPMRSNSQVVSEMESILTWRFCWQRGGRKVGQRARTRRARLRLRPRPQHLQPGFSRAEEYPRLPSCERSRWTVFELEGRTARRRKRGRRGEGRSRTDLSESFQVPRVILTRVMSRELSSSDLVDTSHPERRYIQRSELLGDDEKVKSGRR